MGDCKDCGSSNTYGMSRVVGYYSMIENWNGAKQAEHVDRQAGDYRVPVSSEVIIAEHAVSGNKQEVIKVS